MTRLGAGGWTGEEATFGWMTYLAVLGRNHEEHVRANHPEERGDLGVVGRFSLRRENSRWATALRHNFVPFLIRVRS